MDNKNTIVVFQPENVKTIAELGPVAINENNISHDKCLEAGNALLDRVQREGMNDELDQDIAHFIEKAKRTVKKMNDKRTPVTKLFDAIRTTFTSLESEVNPTTKGSVPAQLQEHRNAFAAAKRQEALRRQREEAMRLERERALNQYKTDVKDDLKRQFNDYVISALNRLTEIDKQLTLENYEFVLDGIKNTSDKVSEEWFKNLKPAVYLPAGMSVDESKKIAQEIKDSLLASFSEQFLNEVGDYRDSLMDRLPSKKKELERIAQSNAEEAARLKAEMERKEREEAERKERERRDAEAKAKAEAELAAKKNEMDSLFGGAQVSVQSYQPKAQVKKRMEVLNPEGFMEVVGMWWSQIGCTMTVEELTKIFSKQVTFCNKLANDKDSPILIQSEHICYVDDIKAK